MRQLTIDLCASAYPDVQPWQVKKQCIGDSINTDGDKLADLFYTYLTLLLHPIDGHSTARKDKEMVKVSLCEDSLLRVLSQLTNSQF